MNKKYLRIWLRQHKFEVWGLNYKLGGQFDQILKALQGWGFNWTWNYLINKIRIQLLNVRSSRGKLKIAILKKTGAVSTVHHLLP
jgi:hypothetical protein